MSLQPTEARPSGDPGQAAGGGPRTRRAADVGRGSLVGAAAEAAPSSASRGRGPRLLVPVLGLTDRLRTRSRLLLLVAVLLVPSLLATGSFATVIQGQVRFARYERAGVSVVGPALQAMAASAAGLDPDTGPLRAAVRAAPELRAEAALRAVEQASPGRGRTAALADLVAHVGDSSKLILDPDLDSFYVMDALVVQMPRALAAVGSLSAPDAGPTTDADTAYLAAVLSVTAAELAADAETATRYTTDDTLQAGLAPVRTLSAELLVLADDPGGQPAGRRPEQVRADLLEASVQASQALADQLDGLLQARADALELRRDLTLALTVAGVLLAVWIAAAVIWRTRHDVDLTLSGVAAISDGDLDEHPLPHGQDEFGDIGRAVRGARERLEGLLFRDPLTGLPNRPMFLDRLHRALGDEATTGVAVLFLDLDRFKAVNDRLGHAAGDELLAAVATRVRGCTRTEDTAARFGGDEFAVLLVDDDERVAARVADRIITALHEPFPLSGGPVHVGVTIGIARAHRGVGADDLLAEADVALYDAKREGGGRAKVYDPVMRAEHLERLQLDADLQSALPQGQLDLAYQPIVRLDTGAVTGFESLLRWHRPGGPVAPLAFVPLAEANGLIVEIGRWVLARTCDQLLDWRRHDPGLVANVNVSARQLAEPAFVEQVEEALRRTGLPGTSLTLEITESILLQDRSQTLDRLGALRELGVRIALDDFGTGYSCLGYLSRLPVDMLKIDRSFVTGATGHAPLLRTVVELGHALGLQTTAEGIETVEQRDLLRRLGCEKGQGYHFGRPLPAAAAAVLLLGHVPQAAFVP